jgi:serine phosphatase RsbU (regulator of sigma subunit)
VRPPPDDAEDKLRDIRSVTDAALSHLDADGLLAALLDRVRAILDADTAAVLLLDSSGRQLVATAASGLEEEVSQGVRIPVGRGFAGRIAAERRPVILDRVDHGTVLNPLLLAKGIRSLVGVPLLVQGAVLGVLHAGTLRDRVFTADDAALLQLAADRAAVAVQSLRTREDRAAALALQRSLVPSALPAVAGVEVAARYVPGSGHVGGDWYDVFVLPSGKLALVVGDVAGSGLGAAVVMGRIRSALRAYALEFPGPADVLGKLDRKMQYFEDNAIMATVGYAVLDPATGQLAVSLAGHLPPVIAAHGQHGALAEIAADLPIGIAGPSRREVTTLTLAPGAVLCLYTDGLVERRDELIDDGLNRLCQAVTPGPAEDVCVSAMQAMVGRRSPGDDIALLVLRWLADVPLQDVDRARDDERGQDYRAGCFRHHEQLGPRLDRRDVRRADRGCGPEGQRKVVDEPRHPGNRHVLRVLHLREDERRVVVRMMCPGGGTAAVEVPVPEREGDHVRRPDHGAGGKQAARVVGEKLVVGQDLHDEPAGGEQVGQGDDRDDGAGGDPQPGFLPVDAARVPDDQHR